MYANLDGLTAIKGTQTATKKSDGDAIADKLNSYEAKEHEALDEKATMTLAEFANLMKDARLLGHRQTRLVFAQAQQAVRRLHVHERTVQREHTERRVRVRLIRQHGDVAELAALHAHARGAAAPTHRQD